MGPAPAVEQRVIPEADLSDVMREQLDFLIDANMAGTASNDQMNRLCRVMAILLEPFDTKRKRARK